MIVPAVRGLLLVENVLEPFCADIAIMGLVSFKIPPFFWTKLVLTCRIGEPNIVGLRPRLKKAVSEPYELPNIPRDLKDVKRAVIPKLDSILYLDYANIELRILGYYLAVALKDYSIVDEIANGDDIHAVTASRMYGKDPGEVTDKERQSGKVLIFSLCYGGGVPTLMRQGVVDTYIEGRNLVASFHESRPGIKRLADKLIKSNTDKGYIRLIDGSRLHPQEDHKTLNRLIQGTGAVIMRRSLIDIYQYLTRARFKSHLILPVHDEFQVDTDRSELYTVVEAVPKLMVYDKINEVIPINTSIEITNTNWAEKQQWLGEVR